MVAGTSSWPMLPQDCSFPEVSWFAIGPWNSVHAVELTSRIVVTLVVPARTLDVSCGFGGAVYTVNNAHGCFNLHALARGGLAIVLQIVCCQLWKVRARWNLSVGVSYLCRVPMSDLIVATNVSILVQECMSLTYKILHLLSPGQISAALTRGTVWLSLKPMI